MIKKLFLVLMFCLIAAQSYATDIDVGISATSREATTGGWTWIETSNGANASGDLDHLEFYGGFFFELDIVFATFNDEGSNTYSTVNTISAISITSDTFHEFDAPGDFSALPITEGDYLGAYIETTAYYDASGGGGAALKNGNFVPASSVTFLYNSGYAISINGSGETTASSLGIRIFGNNFSISNGGLY